MKLSVSQQLQADIAQAMAGLWMAENKLVEATGLYQHVCQLKPDVAGYWLNWAAALRGLRYTVAPYRVLQRGLCNNPENPDLQEALQQLHLPRWLDLKQLHAVLKSGRIQMTR